MDDQSQSPDLLERTQQLAEGAAEAASGALDTATTTVSDVRRMARDAVRDAANAYQEALDDVRSQLPTFDELVGQAARLPGVPVSRAGFLVDVLERRHRGKIRAAIETTPAQAGLSGREIAKLAKTCIGRDARRTTLISMASGIPGGTAAAATIPADLVQLYGHLIRAIQKLSYLYGWRDLVHLDGEEVDPPSRAALMLFLGSMAKVESANATLRQLATLRGTVAADEALRQRLLSADVRAVVDEVALTLGDNLARRLTGRVVDKAIPIVGAVVSGVVTKGDFGGMCGELHRQLQAWGAR